MARSGRALQVRAVVGRTIEVVVWSSGPFGEGTILGSRVSPEGVALDRSPFVIASNPQAAESPEVTAGPGPGRVTVAYTEFTPSLGANRVYVRFIDEP